MAEAFNVANSLFVDEQFEEALKSYTAAIDADSTKAEYFLKRSACHAKLKNWTDALDDANAAIRLEPNNAQGYLRKGTACFSLDEFTTAKTAFEKGLSLDPSNSTWKTWIRKCQAEIESEDGGAEPASFTATKEAEKPAEPAAEKIEEKKSDAPAPAPTPEATPAPAPTTPVEVPKPKPTLRHEWFQTASAVVVSVFAKGLKKEDVDVEILERSLTVSIKIRDTSSEFQHTWELFDFVVPTESTFAILSTKVEIKLKKKSAVQWAALEKVETAGPARIMVDATKADTPSYPSSSKKKTNWDDIAKEADDDKLEGDAALNKVFRDIFSNGSDEQRRAMVKSFVESGGTVLSTNWQDVGARTVEGSPPKGMEMHNWNETQ